MKHGTIHRYKLQCLLLLSGFRDNCELPQFLIYEWNGLVWANTAVITISTIIAERNIQHIALGVDIIM